MNWPRDPGRSWNRPPASGELLHPPAPSRQPHPKRNGKPVPGQESPFADGIEVRSIVQIRDRSGHWQK